MDDTNEKMVSGVRYMAVNRGANAGHVPRALEKRKNGTTTRKSKVRWHLVQRMCKQNIHRLLPPP